MLSGKRYSSWMQMLGIENVVDLNWYTETAKCIETRSITFVVEQAVLFRSRSRERVTITGTQLRQC